MTAVVLALIVATGFAWAAEGQAIGEPHARESSPTVVRIYYDDIRDLEGLAAYDVWEVNNTAEKYVLAAVDPAEQIALRAAGWRFSTDSAATANVREAAERNLFLEGYRTVDEVYDALDSLAAAYPQLTKVVAYGQSECLAAGGCTTPGGDNLAGFELHALRITNEAVPGSSTIGVGGVTQGEKPVFFLMANIHAREITTPELALRMATWLLDSYDHSAEATWLVDHQEIWIVPTVNPDGHWLVELGATPAYGGVPFYHRKNANQDADNDGLPDCDQWPSLDFTQYGVDLNRNHTFGWGPPGSSGAPCDMTFRGPSPGSESEVASLEQLISSLIPDQRGETLTDPAPDDTRGLLITIHSYGDLVLWPWGALYEDAPNRPGLQAIGDKLASFNGYLSCQPTECLYAASGASDDWAYGELGIPAFTFEVGDEFMPNYSAIDAVQWPENRPAFVYAARIARAPYQLALGPDSMDATVTNGTDATATASVIFEELNTGGDVIIAAEVAIDRPFWDSQAAPLPMTAADGSFDSPVETATATLDLAGLAPGRHMVYFHGQDSAGNWGAMTAAFLVVEPAVPLSWSGLMPMIARP